MDHIHILWGTVDTFHIFKGVWGKCSPTFLKESPTFWTENCSICTLRIMSNWHIATPLFISFVKNYMQILPPTHQSAYVSPSHPCSRYVFLIACFSTLLDHGAPPGQNPGFLKRVDIMTVRPQCERVWWWWWWWGGGGGGGSYCAEQTNYFFMVQVHLIHLSS